MICVSDGAILFVFSSSVISVLCLSDGLVGLALYYLITKDMNDMPIDSIYYYVVLSSQIEVIYIYI